jgi:hypothetical protein
LRQTAQQGIIIMIIKDRILKNHLSGIALAALALVSLGGCGNNGPAVTANPQTISFGIAPVLSVDDTTATVSATASSGLAVEYKSTTPAICDVNSSTGVVRGKASGVCTIAANQSGNTHYAPAPQVTQNITFSFTQTLTFGTDPALSRYDIATVSATASSGMPVSYSSMTPAVCSVNVSTGLVTALLTGDCTITADAGPLQSSQTIPVTAPPATATAAGVPTEVSATAGNTLNTVLVSIGATRSGGSPITGYSVFSSPAGITAAGLTSPVTVTCPSTCEGYGFSVTASNAIGNSAPAAPADVITGYNVVETFFEPDTQPKNSIFIGSFTFNSTTSTVSNLHGILSESMTGGSNPYPSDTMTWLPLNYQLSSVYDPTLGGLLVTTFKLNTTNTLSTTLGGGNGWSPGTGFGLYYNFSGANPGNAYAMIFVNTVNPTTVLTQAQRNKLAYADCAPGGMMGSTCMTGTTVAGYGTIGTMSGYPVSQTITKQ